MPDFYNGLLFLFLVLACFALGALARVIVQRFGRAQKPLSWAVPGLIIPLGVISLAGSFVWGAWGTPWMSGEFDLGVNDFKGFVVNFLPFGFAGILLGFAMARSQMLSER